jgi:hypothetical protein
MQQSSSLNQAFVLGFFIFLGLASLGFFISQATLDFKSFDRSVRVKGLSEREYPANIVIWPIQFVAADNQLAKLYTRLESSTAKIHAFLLKHNIKADEITISPPVITDKLANQYGPQRIELRYSARQTVTVYSNKVDQVRQIMNKLADLGKQGIAFTGGDYNSGVEYLFTRLNEVKPAMIEEATTKAREVAEKFAADSKSRLGKIKKASQGSFSIAPRDQNNPHIKKVRVVSTIEYYLAD